jgi:hypothetical protein
MVALADFPENHYTFRTDVKSDGAKLTLVVDGQLNEYRKQVQTSKLTRENGVNSMSYIDKYLLTFDRGSRDLDVRGNIILWDPRTGEKVLEVSNNYLVTFDPVVIGKHIFFLDFDYRVVRFTMPDFDTMQLPTTAHITQ